MFVRVVWQENRNLDLPELFRDPSVPCKRGTDFFPPPGADMRRMTLGLFDR